MSDTTNPTALALSKSNDIIGVDSANLLASNNQIVQSLDARLYLSYLQWNKSDLTYSYNSSIPQDYISQNVTITGWQPVATDAQTVINQIMSNTNALIAASLTPTANSGDIRINSIDVTGMGENGHAYYPGSAEVSGDIFLNANMSTNTSDHNASLIVGDYGYSTVIHELGHALGLKHPFEDGYALTQADDHSAHSVMSYTQYKPWQLVFSSEKIGNSSSVSMATQSISPSSFMVYDMAALHAIYGAELSTATGNNTYQFSDAPFYQTIWDAGGEDTLDFSLTSSKNIIRLSSGSYSDISFDSIEAQIATQQLKYQTELNTSYFNDFVADAFNENASKVYTGENALGIAYGVIIENAIGGSANDIFYDNQVDNALSGGEGNDLFYLGAGGFDTIDGGNGNDTLQVNLNKLDVRFAQDELGSKLVIADNFAVKLSNIEQIQFADTLFNMADYMPTNTAPILALANGLIVSVGGGDDSAHTILQQSNGKFAVFGSWGILRLLPDGIIDTTFSGDGRQELNSLSVSKGIQTTDDKYLVVGSAYNGSVSNFALELFDENGGLVESFGDNGKLIFGLGNKSSDSASNLIQQMDGKIVVSGYSDTGWNNGKQDFGIARLNSDGSFDTSFSDDGKLILPVGSSHDFSYSLIQQHDGKLVLLGESYNGTNYDFSIVRLNSDGSLDTSFSDDGKLILPVGSDHDFARSLIQQNDGKLVIAGYSYNGTNYDFSIVRFNSDGSLDTSFSDDGKLVIAIGDGHDIATSIIQQLDGKLVIAGYSYIGKYSDYSIVRLNDDGSLDQSFAHNGMKTISIGTGDDLAKSIIQQNDEKLVLAGRSYVGSLTAFNGNEYDYSIARLNANGSLDTSFQFSPNNLQESSWYSSIVLAPTAKITDSELVTAGNYAGASLTISRNGGADSSDVFANTGTLGVLTQGSYFSVDSVTIGRVTTNSNGTLTLTFNSNATQALVEKALQQITFATRLSDAPPPSIKLDWTFNDGNTGSQGDGGAKSVTTSLIVNITATNDAPLSYNLIPNTSVTANQAFNLALPTGAFTDPDVVDTLTYSLAMTNGTAVPPWLSINSSTGAISGTPESFDIGSLSLRVTATDSSGAKVSDDFSLTVAPLYTPVTPLAHVKYFVTGSANNFVEFDMDYASAGLSLAGSQILYTGGSGVESVYVAKTISIDFTKASGNTDKIYLNASANDYNYSYQGTTLVLTDKHTNAVVKLAAGSSLSNDRIIFKDGSVKSNNLMDALKANTQPSLDTSLFTPNIKASLYTDLGTQAINTIKAFATNADGATFATTPKAGTNMIVTGGAGVDKVYVSAYASVDATKLSGGTDLIYFTGKLSDYSKSISGTTLQLSRSNGSETESVKVAAGSSLAYDKLVFADGFVKSIDLFNASKNNTAQPTLDTSLFTPGLETQSASSPLLTLPETLTLSLEETPLSFGDILIAPSPAVTSNTFTDNTSTPSNHSANELTQLQEWQQQYVAANSVFLG